MFALLHWHWSLPFTGNTRQRTCTCTRSCVLHTHLQALASHANTCTNDIQRQNFVELSPNNNTCVGNAVRLFQMRASSAIFAQPLCKRTGGRVHVSVQHVFMNVCANVFGPIAYCRSQCAKVFALFVCCAPALGCTKKSPFVIKTRIWRVPETLAIPEAFFTLSK